jgi:hypothetical protein
MNSEGMNDLRVFKRYILRQNCGPIKKEESWRIRTNKEIYF